MLRRSILPALLAIPCLSGFAEAPAPESRPTSAPPFSDGSLREAATPLFRVGAAVNPGVIRDAASRALLVRHFNSVSIENALKPDATQPRENEFTFETADELVDFARARGMEVVGHTLVWHAQTPSWMWNGTAGSLPDRDTALARLERHITGVMNHYRGRVTGWDVVNEAISDRPGEDLRDTPWLRAIGPDYIAAAYRFARAADPAAQLYYNDYNLEIPGKRAAALRLLKALETAGVKVDAVGLQAHYTLQWDKPPAEDPGGARLWPSIDEIEAAILDFHRAGYPVMLTELDMNVLPGRYTGAEIGLSLQSNPEFNPFTESCPPAVLATQARYYGELFRLLLKHRDKVRRVTFWGVRDGDSWLNDWPIPGRTNHPLLFDRSGRPKPALESVMGALREAAPTPPNSLPSGARP